MLTCHADALFGLANMCASLPALPKLPATGASEPLCTCTFQIEVVTKASDTFDETQWRALDVIPGPVVSWRAGKGVRSFAAPPHEFFTSNNGGVSSNPSSPLEASTRPRQKRSSRFSTDGFICMVQLATVSTSRREARTKGQSPSKPHRQQVLCGATTAHTCQKTNETHRPCCQVDPQSLHPHLRAKNEKNERKSVATLTILTGENVLCQLGPVNPIEFPQNGKRR